MTAKELLDSQWDLGPYITWADADAFAYDRRNKRLASAEEVNAYIKALGGKPLKEGVHWVPVADDENEWVYVGTRQPEERYKLGVKFTEFATKGGHPAWGIRDDVPLTYRGLVLMSNEKN